MFIYVKNKDDKPLIPCHPAKARKLLKKGKAKVVDRTHFIIQLLYHAESNVEDVNLGVDAGSRFIGLSATTSERELFRPVVELRRNISKLLESRRSLRRNRRSKLGYRPARVDNRGKKGWIAPSIQNKIDCHITIIRKIYNILPVKNIIVETAEFDVDKLKNPHISGKEYQYGDGAGFYNVKSLVLYRYGYKCQICGNNHDRLEVHHIRFRSHRGSDSMDNLVVLCGKCHSKIHNGELTFDKKSKSFKHQAHLNTMRKKLIQQLKKDFNNVFETLGYLTKYGMEKLGIDKSHVNDAFIISHNPNTKRLDVEYCYRKVRRHNRSIHKNKPCKGGIRKRNQSSYIVNDYRRFDKVMYNDIVYFITGKRISGYFQLKIFDGTVVSQGVSSKKLKLLEPVKGLLIDWRRAIPLRPEEVEVSLP